MKEVTYEEWQKNPTPRMMWVWDDCDKVTVKRKVVYFSKEKFIDYPVIALLPDDACLDRFQHCAEIGEPKKRMTSRQLFEWLAKGNGEYTEDIYMCVYDSYSYTKEAENNEVTSEIKIRTWDSEEWVEPTVDIYERDCKGVKE